MIVFIITTLDSHAKHRINDFVAHGFDVRVYSFVRTNEKQDCSDVSWPLAVIGSFHNSLPYYKRLPILYKGIKKIAKQYNGQNNVCFYYLGLDIAMIATYVVKQQYIYEECDLNHTYIGNPWLRSLFERLDCSIIKKSLQAILTSEGFLSFHKLKNTDNITLIANKLPESIENLPKLPARKTDIDHLSFGFVGSARYETIANFALVLVNHFPQHEFHFWGNIQQRVKSIAEALTKYPNCHFHGRFKSPDDLPQIYSQIDFTLATYDTKFENVRYAEPNKIYEAIYFRTPIIVSKGTFLSEKVSRNRLGFSVNAMDENDIVSFIEHIDIDLYEKTILNIANIPIASALDNNDAFYQKIGKLQ